MDAGSRHQWIGRAVRDVVTYRPGQGMVRYMGTDVEWGYRWCSIPRNEIILETTLER
jgi:UDP-N-acetylmuramate dehydrogenase